MKVTSVKITEGGSGYSEHTTCTFSDGNPGAIHARGKPVVADGKITGVEFSFHGTGYEVKPKITFDDAGGGSGAKGVVDGLAGE